MPKEKVKYIAIEYGEMLHYILKNQLKKQNIVLASKANNKLKNKLKFKNQNAVLNNLKKKDLMFIRYISISLISKIISQSLTPSFRNGV